MTRLTAKRARVPVRVSYRPIIRWDGPLPALGDRTALAVWCDQCVDDLPRGRSVYAVEQQDVPLSHAPDACPSCGYQFPKVASDA